MALTSTRLSAATAVSANRYVTSTDMKVGAYTLANTTPAVAGARRVTVTHTTVTGADTLGTIVVVGKNLSGQTVTDTITPLAGTIATGTVWFASITSVTGAGWVINTGNDTIVVGHDTAAVIAQGAGVIAKVIVNTTAAATITIADSTGTLAVLKASIAEGAYEYDLPWSGYLAVTVAGASDVTITHTSTIPTSYALV